MARYTLAVEDEPEKLLHNQPYYIETRYGAKIILVADAKYGDYECIAGHLQLVSSNQPFEYNVVFGTIKVPRCDIVSIRKTKFSVSPKCRPVSIDKGIETITFNIDDADTLTVNVGNVVKITTDTHEHICAIRSTSSVSKSNDSIVVVVLTLDNGLIHHTETTLMLSWIDSITPYELLLS